MAPNSSLKRKAKSQPIVQSKKAHTDKAAKPEKKRSRPVTLATLSPPEASGTESDGEDIDVDDPADDVEGDWEDEDDDAEAMDEDVPQNPAKQVNKDPNGACI